MRFVGCFVMAICMFSPAVALAACGEQCDAKYASNIDACHTQLGGNPADAAELTDCIQEARDAYRGCLDDCSAQLTRLRRLAVSPTFRKRELVVLRDHPGPRVRAARGPRTGSGRDPCQRWAAAFAGVNTKTNSGLHLRTHRMGEVGLIVYSPLSVGSTKRAALANIGRDRAKLPRCGLCPGTENNKNQYKVVSEAREKLTNELSVDW